MARDLEARDADSSDKGPLGPPPGLPGVVASDGVRPWTAR